MPHDHKALRAAAKAAQGKSAEERGREKGERDVAIVRSYTNRGEKLPFNVALTLGTDLEADEHEGYSAVVTPFTQSEPLALAEAPYQMIDIPDPNGGEPIRGALLGPFDPDDPIMEQLKSLGGIVIDADTDD